MADYKDTLKFTESVLDKLSNKEQKEYYSNLVTGIRDASGLKIDPADEDRRLAQLNFNAISLANQVVFSAFSAGDLTENLEQEYRKLPKIEEVKDALQVEVDKAHAEEDALSAQLNAFRERGRTYDLVLAVCAGRSVEEAKKMQAEYEKRVAQQMQGK